MAKNVRATIAAADTFTEWISPRAGKGIGGELNLSISGTFSATITLQWRFGSSGSALDVEDYTVPFEGSFEEIEEEVQYRLGAKAGNYSSGSAEVRLSK